MKCLYCGKRLALLRKLTDSEFCTDAHRRAYHKEQEQMALARLSDAGKSKRRTAAEPQKPVPDLKDEPGFVDWKHRAADWTGYREIPSEHIPAEPSQFLPEDSVQMQAYPAPAGNLPMETLEGRPIALTAPAAQPVPEPVAVSVFHPPATHTRSTSRRTRLDLRQLPTPAAQYPKTSLVEPFGPLDARQCPQLPVFGDGRLIRMPAAEDVALQLTSLEAAMASHSAPVAPSGGRPLLSRMGNRLIGESSNEHRETGRRADADLPGALVALPRHEARAGKCGPHKVRPRELFFPLPRLGDLSTTASRLGGQNIAITPQSGVSGRLWKPGQVPIRFRHDVRDDRCGKGAAAFAASQPDASWPRHQPSLITAPPPVHELAMAPRLDDVSLFLAGESAQDAPIRVACDLAAEPMGSGVAVPLLWVWMPETSLEHSVTLDPLLPGIVSVSAGSRQSACVAFAPKANEPCFPTASSVIANLALHMDSRRAMAPLAVSATALPSPALRGIGLEFIATKPEVQATFPGSVLRREYEPAFAPKVVPIASGDGVPYPEHTVAISDLSPVWPEAEFLYPQSRNTVIEDSAMREAVRAMSALLAEQNRFFLRRLSLPSISRGDSKWLVMSVPAILLLSLYLLTDKESRPDLDSLPQAAEIAESQPEAQPEVELAAAPEPVVQKRASAAAKPPERAAVTIPAAYTAPRTDDSFLGGIQQTILQRAAVNLSDDFRSGLGDWEGEGDWSKQWAYDAAGFLHTGSLILYKPSLALTDYRMEFLGRIEKKGMGWVYRAADRKNYYAHKIVLTTGGPLPTAVVERYAVIGGKISSLARRPLPMQAQTDTSYRVRMDVRGNGFTLSVQGQIVDHWSDDRLKAGGIGFFSARGEQASLRWVELSHQHDFLGRLCAFLAPYSLPAKEGSLK